jgi:hypothetical protein
VQCNLSGLCKESLYEDKFILAILSLTQYILCLSLQVIPIEGLILVNDEKQKTFEEILPEIMISKYDTV